jgi:hypothetical protein
MAVKNSLPTIEHCTVNWLDDNAKQVVVLTMHNGWVYWDRRDYLDDDGNIRVPEPSEIGYSRSGNYPPSYDFSTIVVAAESDAPADQIYSNPHKPKEEK